MKLELGDADWRQAILGRTRIRVWRAVVGIAQGPEELEEIDLALFVHGDLETGTHDVYLLDLERSRGKRGIDTRHFEITPAEQGPVGDRFEKIETAHRELAGVGDVRSLFVGREPGLSGCAQDSGLQVERCGFGNVALELRKLQTIQRDLRVELERCGRKGPLGGGAGFACDRRTGVETPLGAGGRVDIGEPQSSLRNAKLQGLGEGAVLEGHSGTADLEKAELGIDIDPLFDVFVGFDDFATGPLGHPRLPARRAVGLEPGKGGGAIDDQGVGFDPLFGPPEVYTRGDDRARAGDLGLAGAFVDQKVDKVEFGVANLEVESIGLQGNAIGELSSGSATGDIDGESIGQGFPNIFELDLVDRYRAVEAERFQYDRPGDTERASRR